MKVFTLLLGMAVIAVAVMAAAQAPTQNPKFEVASIKPTKPGSMTWAWCHGTDTPEGAFGGWIASPILPGQQRPPRPALGRCLMTAVTAKMVIGIAYLTFPYKIDEEIAGGPNWAGSDRFDVEAKAESPATEAQLAEMLRPLLADRFKLAFHWESRERSGYDLIVAKNGTKLKEVTDAGVRTRVGGGSPAGGLMTFQAVPIQVLADFLSARLGKRVQDHTGLKGRYTFTLTWTPTENEVVPPGTPPPGTAPQPGTPPPAGTPPPGPVPAASDAGASLLTAIQEELGLRLESAKVPFQVLEIDSVQKPSEN
jgi:uncharacterized protein (TIGR03435 family)